MVVSSVTPNFAPNVYRVCDEWSYCLNICLLDTSASNCEFKKINQKSSNSTINSIVRKVLNTETDHDRKERIRVQDRRRSYDRMVIRLLEILDIRSVTEEMYFLKLIHNNRSDDALVCFNSIFLNAAQSNIILFSPKIYNLYIMIFQTKHYFCSIRNVPLTLAMKLITIIIS